MDNNQFNYNNNPYQQGQYGTQTQNPYYGQQQGQFVGQPQNPYGQQQGQFGGQPQNPYGQQQGQFGGQPQNPYGQQQVQYGDPYYAQQAGQYGAQPYGAQMQKMPSVNLYLFLVIFGFLFGIIWGALSISHYNRLKQAAAAGNYAEAEASAKKIRTILLIGFIVNVLFIIGKMAQSGRF